MKEVEIDSIVDIDTAKRLRAQGFDQPTNLFYQDIDLPNLPAGLRAMKGDDELNHNAFDEFLFSAPTKEVAVKWLLNLVEDYEFKDFDKNDWAHMHDCVYDATCDDNGKNGANLNGEQLRVLFKTLPQDMQDSARHYGMSDTPWRDELYVWCEENFEKAD